MCEWFIQVASVFSMIALVYMRIFLKESAPMSQPLLKETEEPCIQQCEDDMPQKTFKKLPSMGDVICLLKCRLVLIDDINPFLIKKKALCNHFI